jgi:hypothetical protein
MALFNTALRFASGTVTTSAAWAACGIAITAASDSAKATKVPTSLRVWEAACLCPA